MLSCSNKDNENNLEYNNLILVKYLIENLEADATYKSKFGTPLIYALENGSDCIVNYLIDTNKVDANHSDL